MACCKRRLSNRPIGWKEKQSRTMHLFDMATALPGAALVGFSINWVVAGVDNVIDQCGFDWRFHVDTAGAIAIHTLGVEARQGDSGHDYVPTPVRTLRSLIGAIPSNLDEVTFVDFGSGKGRALLVAAEFPFHRIRGVELSPVLHEIAERNIQRYRNPRRRCFDLGSVCMDAADFPIPEGGCVFYFFNPFDRRLMMRIAENIRRS